MALLAKLEDDFAEDLADDASFELELDDLDTLEEMLASDLEAAGSTEEAVLVAGDVVIAMLSVTTFDD